MPRNLSHFKLFDYILSNVCCETVQNIFAVYKLTAISITYMCMDIIVVYICILPYPKKGNVSQVKYPQSLQWSLKHVYTTYSTTINPGKEAKHNSEAKITKSFHMLPSLRSDRVSVLSIFVENWLCYDGTTLPCTQRMHSWRHYVSEILKMPKKYKTSLYMKICFKMFSAKCQPFHSSFNVLCCKWGSFIVWWH